jgi:RimJ/RimL family protein N-acetyltransferase
MNVECRSVNLRDSKDIFLWRNSESARKYSGTASSLAWLSHQDWFASRIMRIAIEPFFVFTMGSNSVGMARFDLNEELIDSFEISILVNPKFQKKGIGTQILKISYDELQIKYPKCSVIARIHVQNLPSIKLFSDFGFMKKAEFEDFAIFEKH